MADFVAKVGKEGARRGLAWQGRARQGKVLEAAASVAAFLRLGARRVRVCFPFASLVAVKGKHLTAKYLYILQSLSFEHISGYHMAVVAGVVFVFVRVAERRPIKKWAAAAALLAAAFYLVLSGAEVATQRAFVMTAIVLLGVMLDRQALTLRTLAVAALAVMVATPEAVVHPSFQMSFAATLALVAAYERGIPWIAASGKTSLGARLALWGGRELVALVFASLVAGLATTLFAAYHFHRLAPYGVLANLLAMPVVSGFVMPTGLLALVAMPFGFDAPVWRLMGYGIDWMTAVALWVASLPGPSAEYPRLGSLRYWSRLWG